MFLQAIGNVHKRQRALINVVFCVLVKVFLLVGYFTIKRNRYSTVDTWQSAQEIATNATADAFAANSTTLNFTQILWDADLALVYTNKTIVEEPEKDILLVVNLFVGVADDVHDKDSWYVVLFSFFGTLIYGWNVLRLAIWIDRKLEHFLDDVSIYERLGDENEFTDFVLDYRNQKDRRPVEMKSTLSMEYDIKQSWDTLTTSKLKAFLPIAPSLIFLGTYATLTFFLSAYHTWMREPHEISENMRAVTNFVSGLEASMIGGKRDVNSFVFVFWGLVCQILFFLTVYRCSELVVRIYCALSGKEDPVTPAFLDSITEKPKEEKEAEKKNE
ncbi:unnamed protein product [Caenorhabditis sp. 36 PRJEB53466]|nr:unnamed protein product [Caenorhabditis sp. 36 PRJEB53466]